jgi:hypothetical protein
MGSWCSIIVRFDEVYYYLTRSNERIVCYENAADTGPKRRSGRSTNREVPFAAAAGFRLTHHPNCSRPALAAN